MPKKVLGQLLREITRDITTNYNIGDKYLTLNEICNKFSVCRQTAHKAVKVLSDKNMLAPTPKSGTKITSKEARLDVAGKKAMLVSPAYMPDAVNSAVLKGIKKTLNPLGIRSELHKLKRETDIYSVYLGDHLLGLDCDGVIGVSFFASALGLYHAFSHGLDMVTDVYLKELPLLPVVQTDNYKNGQKCGKVLREKGFREILVVGTREPEDHSFSRGFLVDRYEGFQSVIKDSPITVHTMSLTKPESYPQLDNFFATYTPQKAVLSLEIPTDAVIATKFHQFNIPSRQANFYVYNTFYDGFCYNGYKNMQAIAPSIEDIGQALAKKLVRKWQAGKWEEPLFEKL